MSSETGKVPVPCLSCWYGCGVVGDGRKSNSRERHLSPCIQGRAGSEVEEGELVDSRELRLGDLEEDGLRAGVG